MAKSILSFAFILFGLTGHAQLNDRLKNRAEKSSAADTKSKADKHITANPEKPSKANQERLVFAPKCDKSSEQSNVSKSDTQESSLALIRLPFLIYMGNAEIVANSNKNGNYRSRSFDFESHAGMSGLDDFNFQWLIRYNTGLFSLEYRKIILYDPQAQKENRNLHSGDFQFLMVNILPLRKLNLRLGYGVTQNIVQDRDQEFTVRFDYYFDFNANLSVWGRTSWNSIQETCGEYGASVGYKFLSYKFLNGTHCNVDFRAYFQQDKYYEQLIVNSFGAGIYVTLCLPKKNF